MPIIIIGITNRFKLNENNSKTVLTLLTGTCDLDFENYILFYNEHNLNENLNENENDIQIEIIKEMAVEYFKYYKLNNDSLPKHIVYYKNITETNLNILNLHKQEVSCLKQAFKDVNSGYIRPYITCILVYLNSKVAFNHLKV
jgi:hypothetical protein